MNAKEQSVARPPSHFYSLNVLRGLAALSVVFCHWRNLFYIAPGQIAVEAERQPLYLLFQPLYLQGWRAVDLFFCLSGFLFYWLYAARVAERAISLREFFVLRFSRLYPLHFLTLILVACGEYLMLVWRGGYFVYPNNTPGQFLLNLGLISRWGQQNVGSSFNGSSWTVAVEALLYALFFLVCVAGYRRWWHLVLLASSSNILFWIGFDQEARGILSFFVGGLTYKVFEVIVERGISRRLAFTLVITTALLWIDLMIRPEQSGIYHIFHVTALSRWLAPGGKDVVGAALLVFNENYRELFLFPATILTAAVVETYRGAFGVKLSYLGDISYSIYLLHFPLQMAFMFAVLGLAWPVTVFYSPWTLFLFFALLIPLSHYSYRLVERPALRWIRLRMLAPASGEESRTAVASYVSCKHAAPSHL